MQFLQQICLRSFHTFSLVNHTETVPQTKLDNRRCYVLSADKNHPPHDNAERLPHLFYIVTFSFCIHLDTLICSPVKIFFLQPNDHSMHTNHHRPSERGTKWGHPRATSLLGTASSLSARPGIHPFFTASIITCHKNGKHHFSAYTLITLRLKKIIS